MLSLKNIRASLASLIHPGVSLPGAGMETPAMRIVAQAAPAQPPAPAATGGPLAEFGPGAPERFARGNPPELADLIKAIGTVKRALPKAQTAPTVPAAALPGRAAPGRPAPRAIAPATDDDGSPQKSEPVDYADIIKTLEGVIEKLKSKVPVDASDEADETSARAAAKSGRLTDAVDRFSALALKLQAKVTAQKKRSTLLSEPSSRQRAHKLRLAASITIRLWPA